MSGRRSDAAMEICQEDRRSCQGIGNGGGPRPWRGKLFDPLFERMARFETRELG